MMSVNNKTIIDLDKDRDVFNIETFNKYKDDLYIFTDGSYHKDKGKWKGKWKTKNEAYMISKFGIYFGMNSINISHQETNTTTINQCELLAIKYSLLVLDNYKKNIKLYQKENPDNIIYIVSDSEYCVKSLTIWINDWLKNNWKTKIDEPVKNKEIFININLLISKLKLHKIRYNIIHCNSHQPPPLSNPKEMFLWKGNQLADFLAKDYIF
jgi:ribonuclease HI